MSTTTVTTQAELDAALAAGRDDWHTEILIKSARGVWLDVSNTGEATVQAYDSATVRAYDSATVRAYDSATVRAYDSATVQAYGSATVQAYGSATVQAYGSATVQASGSATVQASGSATVRAYDSATVRAYDSATVRAYDSATVQAYDSATVRASKFVAVHLHSARVTVEGGQVIDVSAVDLNDPETWATYTGATVADGVVTLYKAVDAELNAGHGWRLTGYPVGEDVTAPDWRDDNECGFGLHASPHPHQAVGYFGAAKRMLEVTIPLADIRPIGGDKAKAQTVHVVREVSLTGDPLPKAAA